MAAGVAHDFNNMLGVIVGRAELLLGRPTTPTVVRGLQEIHRAATNGASTVRRIQNFTGTVARPAGRVSLGEIVRRSCSSRVSLEGRGAAPRRPVRGDGGRRRAGDRRKRRRSARGLHQPPNNALDAMPDGGRCTFRLSEDARSAVVEVEKTPDAA